MVNVTIAVPEELKKLLDAHAEINWSEVARQAWWKKAKSWNLNKLTRETNASDKDVLALAKLIKKGIADWHGAQM